jgi:thiol-disulfide isomerase/thioredoxin
MHARTIIFIAGLALILLFSGCVNNSPPSSTVTPTPGTTTTTAPAPTGDHMAAKQSVQYVPFTLAAYNQAKVEGKTIFLEFYANWCPICQAQAPALEAAIPQIASDKLVAFRVNYKDSETDADEAALAQQLNITYQHTHIIVENGQIKWRSNESLSEQDIKDKLGAYA